jgi:hypothetical protein
MGMSDERYKNQSAMASESPPLRTRWTCVLELDATRSVVAGSENTLVDAIRRGADLRIGTEFLHNEHIDVHSESAERIREVAEFGARPSMSFFLYNQNGRQAVARPYLGSREAARNPLVRPIGRVKSGNFPKEEILK